MSLSNGIVLLGGVALFLFGMGLMGDGLKKIAGDKLELVLYKLTGTPLKGVLLGTGVTAAIQSSSATSIMTVGFVNSEMMKVRQAISVIMGAVVGTSVTGWIISLSAIGEGSGGVAKLLSTETISAFAALAGIVLRMVGKKKSTRILGDILLGFAVLMFGMKSMSSAVSDLKNSERFLAILTGFRHPLMGLLIGFAATAVLQSASATVGILQALSATGVITFSMALPMLLGIAIGAGIPVIVASVGSTTQGKRAAFSYPVIELLCVIVFAAVFAVLNAAVGFSFVNDTINMVGIALLNTVFRAAGVLVLFPFINAIERLLTALIPEKPEETAALDTIRRLEPKFLTYPPLALEQSRLALESMASIAETGIDLSGRILLAFSETDLKEAVRLEEMSDKYEDKIGTYLTSLSGKDLSPAQGAQLTTYLRVLTDFERMCDHALNMAEAAEEIHDKKIVFSPAGDRELAVLCDAAREVTGLAVRSFTQNDAEAAFRVQPLEEVIDGLCAVCKKNHIERLTRGDCVLSHGYVFNDLLTDFERISDHCSNIALAVIEQGNTDLGEHEYEKELTSARQQEFDALYEDYRKKYIDPVRRPGGDVPVNG
jgi:phosphate:Na+ symporter